MPQLLRVPSIAASATEGTLTAWPVAENTSYRATDIVATIETAKAAVDVEAEADGVLLKHLVSAGDDVLSGTPIALIGEPGEVVADLAAALRALGVGGDVTDPPSAEPSIAVPAAAPAAARSAGAGDSGRLFTSPLARRLAREAGLPIETLAGSGPNGRTMRRDVEAAIARAAATADAARAPASDAPAPTADAPAPTASRPVPATAAVPHSRMRRLVADRLAESKRTIPHFYLRGTARVDKLLRLREQLNDGAAVRVSLNDFVVKAVACAHVAVPALNVTWGPDAVTTYHDVDLAVAIASPRGLVTPVLRAVDRTSITAVASTVRDFVERATDGRLQQHELEGGSATVTNLGMFGTQEFAAIINPPQASILAVGAVRPEPVVVKGRLAVGAVMRVTLSVDHRPVDGATAAQWMQAFVSILEHPVQILA